jgi:uncharacterized YigZ family protein
MSFPVSTEEEIKQYLNQSKKEYFDASHHCYAYILGADQAKFRANDDGEPNHSAGDPILGQIRSRNLTNVLVIVVRYFGGVKLGVSGLIAAYREAAADSLIKSTIVEQEVMIPIRLVYHYNATPEVMRLVKEFTITILSQTFNEGGHLTGIVSLKNNSSLVQKIDLLIAQGSAISYHIT